MKEPLPEEAVKMKVDLCLGRGRMVMTQFISSGVVRLDKDEVELFLFVQSCSM